MVDRLATNLTMIQRHHQRNFLIEDPAPFSGGSLRGAIAKGSMLLPVGVLVAAGASTSGKLLVIRKSGGPGILECIESANPST